MCGPISFKMVMDFYGFDRPVEYWKEVTGKEFINGDTGAVEFGYWDEMFVDNVKKLGYQGFCKDNSSIDEIKDYISREIPVIVNWFSPEQGSHFSVVSGVEGDKIYFADPCFGEIKEYNVNWFLERWSDHGLVPMDYPDNDPGWVHRICVVYPNK